MFAHACVGEKMRRFVLWIFVPLFCLAAGCGRADNYPRYQLKGLVVGKSAESGELTVEHGDIPGFMTAMTMPYKVKDTSGFLEVQTGDTITADVVVANSMSNYWLEHLKIVDSSKRGKIADASTPIAPDVGQTVPDVPLVNQDGKVIHLSQFKGKAVLVTFIYTRCPLPDFCPRISSHFAAIHQQLEKQPDVYAKTHLLSISFDPDYDTPPVLKKYGLAYLDDPGGFGQWDFASPATRDLPLLAQAFNLYYSPDGNQIAHSMETVLISPDGKVKENWSDNEWRVDDVLAALVAEAHADPIKKSGGQ